MKQVINDIAENIRRYIKFRRICHAIEIYPYYWQKFFVLYGIPIPEEKMFHRSTGVTTAVLLKLMLDGKYDWGFEEIRKLLEIDPDYDFHDAVMNKAYYGLYKTMQKKCNDKGINVCTFDRFFSAFSKVRIDGTWLGADINREKY